MQSLIRLLTQTVTKQKSHCSAKRHLLQGKQKVCNKGGRFQSLNNICLIIVFDKKTCRDTFCTNCSFKEIKRFKNYLKIIFVCFNNHCKNIYITVIDLIDRTWPEKSNGIDFRAMGGLVISRAACRAISARRRTHIPSALQFSVLAL
jgi:hypothetical protein